MAVKCPFCNVGNNFWYLFLGEPPQKGEKFVDVMADVESKIMPGVVHWNHPRFFAYFPSGNSYPSILGDMLSSAIGSIGFSWVSYTYLQQDSSYMLIYVTVHKLFVWATTFI